MSVERVLVCGGRDFDDREFLDVVLDSLHYFAGFRVVIHGGAKGADDMAGRWASARHIVPEVYRAEWDKHGKEAGPLRNWRMAREGEPDLVVAFPGGKGTASMVRIARQCGIHVIEPKREVYAKRIALRRKHGPRYFHHVEKERKR